jgi:hypothetical protein
MSAAPTPIRECDAALDYLYGLLEGDAKARFETHLVTCARCQEELSSFGKVRAIAKAALPPVEPSERLTGPLHAQLLHAAAQRKPKGKVLPFMRRVFRHPAYAAAAGILIIGGAVGIEWSRGKLLPQTQALVAEDAPAPTPAPTPTATTVPVVPAESAEKPLPATGEDKVPPPKLVAKPSLAQTGGAEKRVAKDDQDGDNALGGLVARSGKAKQDDLDGLYEGDGAGRAANPEHTPAPKRSLSTSNHNGYNSWGSDSSTRSAPTGVGGDARSSGAAAAAPTSAKKVAPAAPPAPEPRKESANQQIAREDSEPAHHAAPRQSSDLQAENQRAKHKAADEERQTNVDQTTPKTETAAPQRNEPPAPAPTPAPVVARGDVVGPNANDKGGFDRNQDAPGATTTIPETRDGNDSIDIERNRGSALAQAGRCEEAVTIFKAIERRVPTRLTSQDRLSYERCLRTLGQIEPAQAEINQMRNHNALKSPMPAAAVEAEQKAIDMDRKRQASRRPARAKKVAPAGNAATAPADADVGKSNNRNNSDDAATKQQR